VGTDGVEARLSKRTDMLSVCFSPHDRQGSIIKKDGEFMLNEITSRRYADHAGCAVPPGHLSQKICRAHATTRVRVFVNKEEAGWAHETRVNVEICGGGARLAKTTHWPLSSEEGCQYLGTQRSRPVPRLWALLRNRNHGSQTVSIVTRSRQKYRSSFLRGNVTNRPVQSSRVTDLLILLAAWPL
jgi:hypothetical protein